MRKIKIFISFLLAISLVNIHVHQVAAKSQTTTLKVVAVGDSLTYGVGDGKHQGGYTHLIQKPLKKASHRRVKMQNFGISGETSGQILKRVQHKAALKKALQNSDIVILTAGGNNIMHVLQKHGLNLSNQQFQAANNAYVQQMSQMVMTIRRYNEKAPIYLIGIYNPYAIYVKKARSVQQAVLQWNQSSQNLAHDNYRMHFVDVSAIAQPKKLKYSKKEQTTTNPLLYTKDYFHPNHQGYQLMTKKLWHQLQLSQKEWINLK